MRNRRDEIYSICIAYEQGYGKGLYNTRKISNPYVESDERVGWGIGYEEGKNQREIDERNKIEKSNTTT